MTRPLWTPSGDTCRQAKITRYLAWLQRSADLEFETYEDLWQWSVNRPAEFWGSIWKYFDVPATVPYEEVIASDAMPGAEWFPGSRLNYVSQVFRRATAERPAIVHQSETAALAELSWAELESRVAAFSAHLRKLGVQPGDRVVGYLPNAPEAAIAFLGTACAGAIWSLCSPDLGTKGVLERFRQIEPKVLIATDSYHYSGKAYGRTPQIEELVEALPSLEALIIVSGPAAGADISLGRKSVKVNSWEAATSGNAELCPEPLPFGHPLWILYSSGTTGAPKAIVHSHGGILIEHLKALHFHLDLGSEDRFHWFSSTAWMMWNYQLGGLLLGATICTYDGNPGWPDLHRLWRFAHDAGVTFFGAGAAFFDACRNAGIKPKSDSGTTHIRTVGSTGSPLSPEAYRWVYDHVGSDVYLLSVSGGTDFASGFVGGVPTLPVYEGEMSCRCLGAAVYAYDDNGESVVNEVGELVCTKPMPSMPVKFWNDADGAKYRNSYFDTWPHVWRHGDWIKITDRGGAIIYGRSDATINRHGIRMGTSELYNAVEALPEVVDSLVVDLEFLGRESYMPLFVVLREGMHLSDELVGRIRGTIRESLSPRHVPNDVFEIDEVPRTFSGKKLEIPIRRLLLGQPSAKVVNPDTMANPQSVDYFVQFAQQLNR